MASYHKTIADAVVTIIGNLSGSPDTVELRKEDAFHPREHPPLVIVTMGDERVLRYVSGAGTDTDQGDVLKEYEIGVTIYRDCLADLSSNLTNNPEFVLACKQALNKKSLAGAGTVHGARLIENTAWEKQGFKESMEVSRFGLIYLSSETRLGN